MSAEMLPEGLLKRKAVVYVRQSTQTQVQTNLESQRRQYDLVEVARGYGFASVEVIDDAEHPLISPTLISVPYRAKSLGKPASAT